MATLGNPSPSHPAPRNKNYALRLATPTDLPLIHAIEINSLQRFLTIPELADLAKSASTSKTFGRVSDELWQEWLSPGRVYIVSELEEDEPVGMIAAMPRDKVIYIHEIAVLEKCQRMGFGRVLLRAVFEWARMEGQNVSLTCYADVEWNGPWYRRHGFKEVDAASLGSWHVGKMEYDRDVRGLVRPGLRRCCMLWTGEISESEQL